MRKFSIAIDGFNLALAEGTGVSTYGRALGHAICSMGIELEGLFGLPVGKNPDFREVLFYEALGRGVPTNRKSRFVRWVSSWTEMASQLPVLNVPIGGIVDRDGFQSSLPPFDRILSGSHLFERAETYFRRTKRFLSVSVENPPDIMHWTYPVPVLLRGAKNIYTLHDLVPMRLPHTTLDRKRYYHRLIQRCIEHADHVCTVSEASRNDIIDLFDVAQSKITNTYQHAPVPPELIATPDKYIASEIEGIFGLKWQGYFLFFGAIEPKKNVARLVEAYLSIQTSTPLVIVGAKGWQSDKEVRLISAARDRARSSAAGRQQIMVLDYLPRQLLLKLVRGARAVTFPSLYEGFGLPVIEAMQLGTPVLIGNRSALPEIAGDAALAVDPYDVQAIASGLTKLDGQAALRDELVRRGRAQAERFSIGIYRQRLHDMYSRVMNARPSS